MFILLLNVFNIYFWFGTILNNVAMNIFVYVCSSHFC